MYICRYVISSFCCSAIAGFVTIWCCCCCFFLTILLWVQSLVTCFTPRSIAHSVSKVVLFFLLLQNMFFVATFFSSCKSGSAVLFFYFFFATWTKSFSEPFFFSHPPFGKMFERRKETQLCNDESNKGKILNFRQTHKHTRKE